MRALGPGAWSIIRKMNNNKQWIIERNDRDDAASLAGALRLSPVTALLLLNRGIRDPEQARAFLHPSLHQLCDPCGDGCVRAAAGFLKEAIKSRGKITVYGDFDADGICAGALMVRALKAAGASVDFYVPHRFDEGYGLNTSALDEIRNSGSEVVITVDCGTGANAEIEHANRIGLKVVVTDHHQQRGELPPASHLLNPHLEQCSFGYENLSGVGVAFKLAWALGQSYGKDGAVSPLFREILVDLLPLAAIGTVADMVPMEDENRVLVNYGLRLLPSTEQPGIQALLRVCGLSGKTRLSTYNVGYQIAPRLNAVGRMSDARAAIEMLITSDVSKAERIAGELECHNRNRQKIQRTISEQAVEMAASSHDLDNCSCIVLSSPDWHPGVVGLVASRLADHFSRPAFVFYEEDGLARGSARSVPGLHLFDAVSRCSDLLHRFGGHRGAAGLTLATENMQVFRESILEVTRTMLGPKPPQPELHLEAEVELSALSQPAVEEFSYLEPFGESNPQPLFAAKGLHIAGNPQLLGARRNHLSFLARQNDTTLRVIAFGKAEWLEKINRRRGERFSLAFEPRINTYNRSRDVELRAEDIRWDDEMLVDYK